MKNLFLFLLVFQLQNLYSQVVPGQWTTFNDDNQATAVVELTIQEDGTLSGTIKDIYIGKDDKCNNCKGRHKDKPQLGLEIVWGFQKKNDKTWTDGKILDPDNGKIYSCKMQLKDENTLKVRGYIGTPLLGETVIWKRKL